MLEGSFGHVVVLVLRVVVVSIYEHFVDDNDNDEHGFCACACVVLSTGAGLQWLQDRSSSRGFLAFTKVSDGNTTQGQGHRMDVWMSGFQQRKLENDDLEFLLGKRRRGDFMTEIRTRATVFTLDRVQQSSLCCLVFTFERERSQHWEVEYMYSTFGRDSL